MEVIQQLIENGLYNSTIQSYIIMLIIALRVSISRD